MNKSTSAGVSAGKTENPKPSLSLNFYNPVMKLVRGYVSAIFYDRRKAIVAVILIIIALVFLWRSGQNKSAGEYQTSKVERGTIVSSVTASGQILTANIVNITTQASGLVKAVYVKDGDQVTAGQKLADITSDPAGQQAQTQAWASYLSAKNALDTANTSMFSLQSDMLTKWNTYMNLAQNTTYQNSDGSPNVGQRQGPQFVSTQDDWLAAEAKYKTQQNVIAQAQASLTSAWANYQLVSPTVTAPMAGMVDNVTITPGMMLTGNSASTSNSVNNQRVAIIRNSGNPLSTFNVSEIDVAKVKPGQKATITLDSLSGKTFTGKVLTVDHIGSVTSGVTNYPVVLELDTTTPEILPNMAATAHIILDSKDNALLVPSGAVQSQGDQSVVRVLKNGQPQYVQVDTGLTSDTQTEIVSGLSEGDVVVTGSAASSTQTGRSVFSGLGGTGGRSGFIGR